MLLPLLTMALPAFAEGGSAQAIMSLIVLPSDANTPGLSEALNTAPAPRATAAYVSDDIVTMMQTDSDTALKICMTL